MFIRACQTTGLNAIHDFDATTENANAAKPTKILSEIRVKKKTFGSDQLFEKGDVICR